MYVIKQPIPLAPAANVLAEWNVVYYAHNEVACLMLGSMNPELYRQLENSSSYEMLQKLKSMFEKQARVESNGIYEIDVSNSVPNVNSIYNVSNKRVKHNLDIAYQWHCRLAHISKKRIEKLQHDGLLKTTDDESFDQCVSCLSGKMTRNSFPHHPERATGLLGLIHTDVCGPLKHVSRQGASYFITFTDDYSHYGYIYLLKHKHELTPFYTPQHNGVFERRNRTLLAMVRSMINLTTLPLSFWDYAHDSAVRILNMVPPKKVDETPYKLWLLKCLGL
nr:retrotransposon protein, putative, Ty1-copia subclass [Tanacetum cinerariifolium]